MRIPMNFTPKDDHKIYNINYIYIFIYGICFIGSDSLSQELIYSSLVKATKNGFPVPTQLFPPFFSFHFNYTNLLIID